MLDNNCMDYMDFDEMCMENNVVLIKDIWMESSMIYKVVTAKNDKHDFTVGNRFINVELWPCKSNLACWFCDRYFNTRPVFVPLNPMVVSGLEQWNTDGNFCSWNCVVAYVKHFISRNQQWDIIQYIGTIAKQFGVCGIIKPSPPKTTMVKYCGKGGITEEQYQDLINDLNTIE